MAHSPASRARGTPMNREAPCRLTRLALALRIATALAAPAATPVSYTHLIYISILPTFIITSSKESIAFKHDFPVRRDIYLNSCLLYTSRCV